jgi:uncharacterized protein (TIGR02246 family)
MRTTLLLVTLVALSACQQQANEDARATPDAAGTTTDASPSTGTTASADAAAQTDPAAVRAEVDQLRNDWLAAAERDDAAAVAQLYAEDAVVLSSDGEMPLQGRDAIQKAYTTDLPMVSKMELRPQDFHVSGDLAYDFGEFTQQVTLARGKPMTISGNYLVILRRQDDGAWKLVKQMTVDRAQKSGTAG